MLYASPTLSTAYFFKEDFLKILDCKDRDSAKFAMSDWINSALDSDIPQLQKCANTMMNWLTGILNSFSSTITNGFTEGCNNKSKSLNATLTVTEISTVFVIVFYIYFLFNLSILKNKRQLDAIACL